MPLPNLDLLHAGLKLSRGHRGLVTGPQLRLCFHAELDVMPGGYQIRREGSLPCPPSAAGPGDPHREGGVARLYEAGERPL